MAVNQLHTNIQNQWNQRIKYSQHQISGYSPPLAQNQPEPAHGRPEWGQALQNRWINDSKRFHVTSDCCKSACASRVSACAMRSPHSCSWCSLGVVMTANVSLWSCLHFHWLSVSSSGFGGEMNHCFPLNDNAGSLKTIWFNPRWEVKETWSAADIMECYAGQREPEKMREWEDLRVSGKPVLWKDEFLWKQWCHDSFSCAYIHTHK